MDEDAPREESLFDVGEAQREIVLRSQLSDLAFPLRREEIRDLVGSRPVDFGDRQVLLEVLLRAVPERTYLNAADLAGALRDHWDEAVGHVGALPPPPRRALGDQ